MVKADQLFDYTDIFDENWQFLLIFPQKMLLTQNAAIFNILSTSPDYSKLPEIVEAVKS